MLHNRQTRRRCNYLFVGGLLCVSLLASSEALAAYRPPQRPSRPRTSTTTTGVRGTCSQGLNLGLTALAPLSHVGQTTSSHPTVAWYVSDTQSYALKFRLYRTEAGPAQGLVYETELPSQPGIMQLKLPESQPGLAIGQRYTWQVVMLCDPNSPSRAIATGAELEVVAPAPVVAAIANKTAQGQAAVYAELGLWYDALQVALQEMPRSKQPTIALLNDLATSESTATSARLNEHGQRLRQIGAAL